MIWATVSSQSSFCWLYRASPSLAAKNIINLISVLTIWWWPYVVFSCICGRRCLLWPVHSLGRTLLAFALLHSVLQGQNCLLLQVFLDLKAIFKSCLKLFWKIVHTKERVHTMCLHYSEKNSNQDIFFMAACMGGEFGVECLYMCMYSWVPL